MSGRAIATLASVTLAAAAQLLACAHGGKGSDAAGAGGAQAGEIVLSVRPTIGPLGPFAAPVPKLHKLSNGLSLYVVEKEGDGMEALLLVVRRGSATDPAGLEGLASLAIEMLDAGSAGRSQAEMARALDAIGASVHASAGLDGSTISGAAMVQRLAELVPLFADVALRPNFDGKEWSRLLGLREAELLAERAEPRAVAARAFARALYQSHPYGRPVEGTVESVKAMRLEDAKAFFSAFRPGEAALVAVGGAREAEVVALLEKAFAGWAGANAGEPALPQAAAPPIDRPRLVEIDFPGKPQTVVRVGQPSVQRSSPDVLALRVWNSVLGGSFTSRLEQNLREKHGYTYGARSGFQFGVGAGPFAAVSEVKTEVTAEALRELLGEVERAVAAPITDAELAKGKALLAYGLVQGLEHAESAAGLIGQLFLNGLEPDELATFPARLRKLTVADVQAAARRALDPSKMTIVLAGDLKKVEPQLAAAKLGLPAPERRDAKGDVVSTEPARP